MDVVTLSIAKNYTDSKISGESGGVTRPFNNIKQIADYLFEVQYSTGNIDYTYANRYFHTSDVSEFSGGACTGIVKDGQVLRHLDYYYDDNVEFIVRRPADPENNVYGSISVCGGIRDLTKDFVESGAYSDKYKIVPFAVFDGINDQGLYIQHNVVSKNGIEYNINSGSTVDCCATMLPRYILDHCATFEDVEDVLNNVHVYSNPSLGFGSHFLIAIGDVWKIIELTSDSYVIVTEGIETNQMPHGIITNFRTNGVTFTDGEIDWDSIESYGMGVERFEIAMGAFTNDDTLEDLREPLKFSHFYADENQTWKTELSGEEVGEEGSHKLTVQDAISDEYADAYTTKFAKAKTNYINRTRTNGLGTWHTTHSAIYDLNNKTMDLMIQERFGQSYNFSLNDTACEKIENKVTSLSAYSTDTEYPSAKCVYDLVGNIEVSLTAINNALGGVL